jgi:hypothetical protein
LFFKFGTWVLFGTKSLSWFKSLSIAWKLNLKYSQLLTYLTMVKSECNKITHAYMLWELWLMSHAYMLVTVILWFQYSRCLSILSFWNFALIILKLAYGLQRKDINQPSFSLIILEFCLWVFFIIIGQILTSYLTLWWKTWNISNYSLCYITELYISWKYNYRTFTFLLYQLLNFDDKIIGLDL